MSTTERPESSHPPSAGQTANALDALVAKLKSELLKRNQDYGVVGELIPEIARASRNHAALLSTQAELVKALERAIQHIPDNAIDAVAAMTKPINECRTLDYCEAVLTRARSV